VQSLEEIKQRVPAVACAKIWCFLFVTLDLPAREGHSLNKCCHGLFIDFDAIFIFSPFFARDCPLRCARVLIVVVRWRHNFRQIEVKSKIVKSPKIGEKVCAPHFK